MATTSQYRPVWTPARKYPAESASSATARTVRRIATLERNSPRLVNIAARAGVDITYLGIAQLFGEPRAYPGQDTDWIIGPAGSSDTVIPMVQKERLQKLVHAGIDFPMVYVAHEIPKGQVAMPGEMTNTAKPQPVTLDQTTAAQAIGPVPPPAGTSALAERLADSSQRLLDAAPRRRAHRRSHRRRTFVIAAAPFALARRPRGRPGPYRLRRHPGRRPGTRTARRLVHARPMGVARHTQQRQLRRTTARSLSRNASHRGLTSPSARILRYCLGRRHMPPDSPPRPTGRLLWACMYDSAFYSSSISLSAAWSGERHILLSSGGVSTVSRSMAMR